MAYSAANTRNIGRNIEANSIISVDALLKLEHAITAEELRRRVVKPSFAESVGHLSPFKLPGSGFILAPQPLLCCCHIFVISLPRVHSTPWLPDGLLPMAGDHWNANRRII